MCWSCEHCNDRVFSWCDSIFTRNNFDFGTSPALVPEPLESWPLFQIRDRILLLYLILIQQILSIVYQNLPSTNIRLAFLYPQHSSLVEEKEHKILFLPGDSFRQSGRGKIRFTTTYIRKIAFPYNPIPSISSTPPSSNSVPDTSLRPCAFAK